MYPEVKKDPKSAKSCMQSFSNALWLMLVSSPRPCITWSVSKCPGLRQGDKGVSGSRIRPVRRSAWHTRRSIHHRWFGPYPPHQFPPGGLGRELCRVTSTEFGRLLLRQRAHRHAHWDFLCEGGPNLSGKVCCRWVIVMSLGVIQWRFHWVFSRKFTLERPHSR